MEEEARSGLRFTGIDTDHGQARRIRVASYNVHGCIGTDGVFEPSRIAGVIAALNADFIALQEVEDRHYEGIPVSQFFVDALGLHAAARTTHKRAGFDYGNLLLSRVAPEQTLSHDLAVSGREPRGAVEAHFAIGGYNLRMIATHFGLSIKERRTQLRKLLPYLEKGESDLTVLCADFNEWLPYSRVHRELRRVLGGAPAVRTFPSRMAALSLDRIYASPARALLSMKSVATSNSRIASDHLPIVADFDLTRIADK